MLQILFVIAGVLIFLATRILARLSAAPKIVSHIPLPELKKYAHIANSLMMLVALLFLERPFQLFYFGLMAVDICINFFKK